MNYYDDDDDDDDDHGLPDGAFTEDELAAGIQYLARGIDRGYLDDDDLEDSRQTREPSYFKTYQEATAWAKNNPGKAFTKSPDGNGYIVKVSKPSSTDYNVEVKNSKQYVNIRPLVYEKIKHYLTREQSQAEKKRRIDSICVTREAAKKILDYINDNDVKTYSWTISSLAAQEEKIINYDTHLFNAITNIKIYSKSINDYKEDLWRRFTCAVSNTPYFSLCMYFKPNGDSFLSVICFKSSYINKKNDYKKEKIYKSIFDLYIEILNENSNDIIDILFKPKDYISKKVKEILYKDDKYKRIVWFNTSYEEQSAAARFIDNIDNDI